MKVKNEEALCLNDSFIADFTPSQKEGVNMFNVAGAFTKIEKYLGFESHEIQTSSYKVLMNASCYLADIRRFNLHEENVHHLAVHTEILFTGGITIYSRLKNFFPDNYHFHSNNRLWFARPPLKFGKGGGLFDHIFEGDVDKKKQNDLIEKIIKGYTIQKQERERILSESYERGRGDALERAFGTFGRGRS